MFSQIDGIEQQVQTHLRSGGVFGATKRYRESLPLLQQKNALCDSLRAVASDLADLDIAQPPAWDKYLFGSTREQRVRADSVLEQRHAELLALDSNQKGASDNEIALAKRVEAVFQGELRRLSHDDASYESELHKFEWKALVSAFGGQFNMPNDLRSDYSKRIDRGEKSGISDAATGATFEQTAAAGVVKRLKADLSATGPPPEWKVGNWRLRQEYVAAVVAQRAHRAAQRRADEARIRQIDARIQRMGPDTQEAFKASGAKAGTQLGGLTRDIGDSLHRRKLFNELRLIAILRRVELLAKAS